MQKELDRLLEEEKEAERIINEAGEKAAAAKAEIDRKISDENRQLKEQVREIVENAVLRANEDAETRYREELRILSENPVSLSMANKEALPKVMDKACGIIKGAEI